ncbi:DUF642 domain-containing protein [Streptomyces sp. AK02-04a]|uniref:DUF642 domain-containing protein n=1 Tax=Streptomyces sp. AK02-04a TaxID=3028649 RepID=UPI0029A10714|nr:DUF642 domain-containing protein [Streptomyces sp. AK02-04a]MDX3763307.1 DUF642 domain-containing protein [Streptomyces sp. AK02-04a]
MHVIGTNWNFVTPTHWGGNGATISADAAKHPKGLQAANLNFGGGPAKLYVNLRGVHKGDKVTITYDDSPSTYTGCTLAQVQNGQKFTIGDGQQNQALSTKGTSAVGAQKWELDKTYTFTASKDNTQVTFASQMPQGTGSCGPMLANVRVAREPAAPDTTVPKVALPDPQAYNENEPLSVQAAVDYCNGTDTQCAFTMDPQASYQYYDKARVVGEVHMNCGRNSFDDGRDVEYTEKPFDSISQYYAKNDLVMTPPDDISEGKPKLANQVARGFEETTNSSWTWKREVKRSVAPAIQPGEVSWIELEAARQRVVGYFTSIHNGYSLFSTFDAPSDTLPDRWYQRTGPMTVAEYAMCSSDRKTAITPQLRSGLVAVAPQSRMTATRSVQLNPKGH